MPPMLLNRIFCPAAKPVKTLRGMPGYCRYHCGPGGLPMCTDPKQSEFPQAIDGWTKCLANSFMHEKFELSAWSTTIYTCTYVITGTKQKEKPPLKSKVRHIPERSHFMEFI
jgi:hypothetical protein